MAAKFTAIAEVDLGRFFLKELPDYIYVFDLINKKNIYSNKGIERILGYTASEFQALPDGGILKLIHPDDVDRCYAYMDQISKIVPGAILVLEYRLQHKEGHFVWLRSREIALDIDEDGNVISLLGIAQDIDDYKKQEEELIRSRDFIESTINNIQEVIYSADAQGRITYISNRSKDLFELSNDEILKNPKKLDELIFPEDRAKREGILKCLMAGGTCAVEYRVLLPSKTIKYIRESAKSKVSGPNDVVVRIDGSLKDITSQKEAQRKVYELNELYEQALKATNDGIWRYEGDTGEWFISEKWKDIFGYDKIDLVNHIDVWRSFIFPEDLEKLMAQFKEALENRSERFESFQRVKHKNGHWVSIVSRAVIIYYPDGRFHRMVGAITDVTERKEFENRLLESRKMLEEAQRIAKIGTYEIDIHNGATRFADSFFQVLGIINPVDIEAIKADPRVFNKFIYPEDKELVNSTFLHAKEYHTDISVEYRVLVGHQLLFVSSKAHLIKDEKGKASKYTGTIQDITERKMREFELIFAKQEAELASNAKSQFLSIMSHEIRTPLNAVIGMTYVLMRENPQPEQAENLKILKSSAEHLLDLVNNILDYNKIEAGKVSFDEEDFNLSEFVENVRKVWTPMAAEKGLELHTAIDPGIPNWLRGDTSRLLQVINNLVSNAVKFTLQGSVTLSGELLQELEDGLIIRLSVSDTGIGIPHDKQQSVFGVFNQIQDSSTRQYGGSGLGLAICSRLLEFQGSKLLLESEPGKGSKFYFDLKFSYAYPPEVMQLNQMDDFVSDLNGLKVLVVEDNETNRQVMARFLKAWNTDYRFAYNGAHGIEMVISFKPDVVLMDIQMPVMDGFAATEGIRQMDGDYYQNLPIIALTASTLMETKDRIFASGLNDFVEKPFNPDKLYRLLENYYFKMHTQ
jgi:PAS domain S-box-containing protein